MHFSGAHWAKNEQVCEDKFDDSRESRKTRLFHISNPSRLKSCIRQAPCIPTHCIMQAVHVYVSEDMLTSSLSIFRVVKILKSLVSAFSSVKQIVAQLMKVSKIRNNMLDVKSWPFFRFFGIISRLSNELAMKNCYGMR